MVVWVGMAGGRGGGKRGARLQEVASVHSVVKLVLI